MNLFAISQKASERNLPSLLIGGHAVIAHGHPRNTFDLALVIRRPELGDWRTFMLKEGYSVDEEGPTFLQFDPPNEKTLLLDLMVVGPETAARGKHSPLFRTPPTDRLSWRQL